METTIVLAVVAAFVAAAYVAGSYIDPSLGRAAPEIDAALGLGTTVLMALAMQRIQGCFKRRKDRAT